MKEAFSVFQDRDVEYWQVLEWRDSGLEHGFIGATVDTKSSPKEWEKLIGSGERLYLLNQVHSDSIVVLDEVDQSTLEAHYEDLFSADGWFVNLEDPKLSGLAFGVRSADCFPVILYDPSSKLAAILHCGWKGTVAGILVRATELFGRRGAKLENVEMAIGPGAQCAAYEIGEEVAERFLQSEQNFAQKPTELKSVIRLDGRIYGDIAALLEIQAVSLGLQNTQVYRSDLCTISSEKFFSFRRQKALAGRQVSYLKGYFKR